ncbi:MAG: hypothetical protein WD336_11640 [Trueperaceae bacterium]
MTHAALAPDRPTRTHAARRPTRRTLRAFALLTAAVALLTFTAAPAQAQSQVGIRTGYPFGATLHVGFGADPNVRVSGMVRSSSSGARFGVGVDMLWPFTIQGPVRGYVGGGANLLAGRGDAVIGAHGLLGGEFRFIDAGLPQLGVFLEGTAGLEVSAAGRASTTRLPAVGAGLGVNWWF